MSCKVLLATWTIEQILSWEWLQTLPLPLRLCCKCKNYIMARHKGGTRRWIGYYCHSLSNWNGKVWKKWLCKVLECDKERSTQNQLFQKEGSFEDGCTKNMSQRRIFGINFENKVSNTTQENSTFEGCGDSQYPTRVRSWHCVRFHSEIISVLLVFISRSNYFKNILGNVLKYETPITINIRWMPIPKQRPKGSSKGNLAMFSKGVDPPASNQRHLFSTKTL